MDRNSNSRPFELPDGVSLAEWSLEKVRWQNPRIRSFLGCIRVLDEVFESNYAILNCSPNRLMVIWSEVRKVAEAIRKGLAPLLRGRSVIPALEEARGATEAYLNILDERLLTQIDRFPEEVPEERYDELRRLLCVAIGQLHSFLLDTLGEILAADPRSQHDADYFLARRFARDVDEAEWLHTSVGRLESYIQALSEERCAYLAATAARITAEERVPTAAEWQFVSTTIDELANGLAPRLTKVLGLRGIRLSELELLDDYTAQVPAKCTSLHELYDATAETLMCINAGTGEDSQVSRATQGLLGRRIARMLREINDLVRDLEAFVSVWRKNIENRRALMLSRKDNV